MKAIIRYLGLAFKYFAIQSIYEVIMIVALTYMGMPYSGMKVGNESLSEIIIGTAGYYTFSKIVFYGWAYLLLFTGISAYQRFSSLVSFSLLNGIISLSFIGLIYFNGKSFAWILNPLIATIISSLLVAITTVVFKRKKISTLQ